MTTLLIKQRIAQFREALQEHPEDEEDDDDNGWFDEEVQARHRRWDDIVERTQRATGAAGKRQARFERPELVR